MVLNLAHYSFFTIPDPEAARQSLQNRLEGSGILGTVLIAREGVNMNLAGRPELLRSHISQWLAELGCKELTFKESFSTFAPFRHLKVKVKAEIVTMGDSSLDVTKWTAPHMSPSDFANLLENPGDAVILDTRNDFEADLGSFKGAKKLGMKSFREFPKIAESFPKDKPIVMFCTGGIRCEKASAYLRSRGFDKVFQLGGGILKYLEEQGDRHFDGECFVFDERFSVNGKVEGFIGRAEGEERGDD